MEEDSDFISLARISTFALNSRSVSLSGNPFWDQLESMAVLRRMVRASSEP